ncbi:MAG: hypothetical protein M1481_01545 [Candidatus Thermoplasmatota archaeon]|jgi:vacuolar-type H+-ATPase subunit E/Vma4|nr:hypothetical protein [Candidatus Thermoplasmatota archaeon]
MSMEALKEDLHKKGLEIAGKNIADAQEEAKKIIAEGELEARKLREKAMAELRNELVHMKNYAVQNSELESRRRISTAKKAILDRMKESMVREVIPVLGRSIIEKWDGMLIKRALNTIPNGYIKMDPQLYSKLAHLSSYTYEGNLNNSAGGIIVESSDRTLVLNLTYENILSAVWEKRFSDIYSVIFSD